MKSLKTNVVKRKLKGKSRIKQEYFISIHSVTGLQSVENQRFYLVWKRGDKAENNGSFSPEVVTSGKIVFSPPLEIHLKCTLFVGKDGKYDDKPIAFSLHPTGKKSKEPFIKGKLNLSEFSDLPEPKGTELKLVGKKGSGILSLLFKSDYAGEGDSMDETEILLSEDNEIQHKDVLDLLVSQQANNHSNKPSGDMGSDSLNYSDVISTSNEEDKTIKEMTVHQIYQDDNQETKGTEGVDTKEKKQERQLKEETYNMQREESFKLATKNVSIRGRKDEKLYSANELTKILNTKTKDKTKQLNQLNNQLEKIDSYELTKKMNDNSELNVLLQKKQKEAQSLNDKNQFLQDTYDHILNTKTKEAHQNILLIDQLIHMIIKTKGKFDLTGRPLLVNSIHQIITKDIENNVEVPALNFFNSITPDTTADALYHLLTIVFIAGTSLKPSRFHLDFDGSFHTQIQILFNKVFMKYVSSSCELVTPIIQTLLFSKTNVSDPTKTNFEDLTANYIVKQIHLTHLQLEKHPIISPLLISQIYTQIFHFIAYLIIDIIINNPQYANPAKGKQIKYFTTYLQQELKKVEPEICNSYWSFFQPVVDVANLLILNVNSMKTILLDDTEIQTTFSSIPVSLIDAIIKVLVTDDGPVPNDIIESVHERVIQVTIPNSYTIVV
ncbi:C2 NT-type domain-containing protein [Entamoeba marina]